jgi:hypothetical protein
MRIHKYLQNFGGLGADVRIILQEILGRKTNCLLPFDTTRTAQKIKKLKGNRDTQKPDSKVIS